MTVPRSIIVDDTSPLIQYQGPWFVDSSGSQDNNGILGPTFNKTLHGTVENATFSFAYSGTGLNLVGSNLIRNDTGTPDPQWECSIDGITLATSSSTVATNNWSLCNTDSTPIETNDGPHVLTVKVTVRQSQTFWVDKIVYTPSPSVSLDDKTVIFDNNDPALQYGAGWGAWGGGANFTEQTGSTFNFNFTGISLGWYAYIATERPHVATNAMFFVDGGPPTTFPIAAIADPNGATIYNQHLFETPVLPFGPHLLNVVFQGNPQTTSLILDYLVVQNGTPDQTATTSPTNPTNPTTTTSPASTTHQTTTSTTTSSQGRNNIHSHLGLIVGGGIAALIVILGLILVSATLYRRLQQKQRNEYERPRGITTLSMAHDRTPKGRRPFIEDRLDSPSSKPSARADISLNTERAFLLPSERSPQLQTNTSPEESSGQPLRDIPHTSPPSHPLTGTHPQSTTEISQLRNIVFHEDSGIRNVSSRPSRVPVEVPPPYTLS